MVPDMIKITQARGLAVCQQGMPNYTLAAHLTP